MAPHSQSLKIRQTKAQLNHIALRHEIFKQSVTPYYSSLQSHWCMELGVIYRHRDLRCGSSWGDNQQSWGLHPVWATPLLQTSHKIVTDFNSYGWLNGLVTPPGSRSNCCRMPATTAGLSGSPQLLWLGPHTPPSERGPRRRTGGFRPWWSLSVCRAAGRFSERRGCGWARPPRPALASPLHSASESPFCPRVWRPLWLSRRREGPSTRSR